MPQKTKTVEQKISNEDLKTAVDQLFIEQKSLNQRIDSFAANFDGRIDSLTRAVTGTERKSNTIEIDAATRRSLALEAQFLGLRSPDQLAQIICKAFIEMIEQEGTDVRFPLALQQVESLP